ncbi:RabGAP/TBC [Xylona heveae TC161]|uniref:RabGAP/TBC n=1 Tax=Xylona heveae (strain CBS 132557 / TC161) TaxID=1328760 RepID=A0A165HFQ2_XYLHT|nr:RabGAP/TBC [Xylona heveae TC161]KZF23442.1 RabGAP/TBC [Xylona heveae TC161]
MDDEPTASLNGHNSSRRGSERSLANSTADPPSSSPTSQWERRPLSAPEANKAAQILGACELGDVEALSNLATSEYGLVEDNLRRAAWPILLGCKQSNKTTDKYNAEIWKDLPRHRDEDQVSLDVNRSFVYYPKDQSPKQIDRRKEELQDLITAVLRLHPELSYFQGYHDIVQVLLLVLGPETSAVARLSLLRIRDFMLPSLTPALAHLNLLPPLLYAADSKLCRHLSQTQPFFALAATLTLYAHDIQEYGDIARLFDFLIAQEAAMSVYFFAVIVLSRKEELFDIPPDEPEMLHSILSKLPKPLELEGLISKTMQLYDIHPPSRLPFGAWRRISRYSVLKTTRTPVEVAKQSLKEGEDLFQRQVTQLRREKLRQDLFGLMHKYKRPAGMAGLAISIAIISWLLRRQNILGSYAGLDKLPRLVLSLVQRTLGLFR